MIKSTKLKVYLVATGGLIVVFLALLLSRLNVSVQLEPLSPERSRPEITPSPPVVSERVNPPSPSLKPESPSPAPASPNQPRASLLGKTNAGILRVSNRTDHPVRVALLPQQRGTHASNTPTTPTANATRLYSEPVHWDFAPEEGSSSGLILSLPDGGLSLEAGDVLVVFAQDGSQRYWGPYVVGKTNLPTWDSQAKEWQLILQP